MKLEPEITLEQFRDEMQHRVVKYPLNSQPVRQALRFARRHDDPAFLRIATDKIHAQKQFQRELHGPSKMERIIDFVTLGSLREVFAMIVLVVAGIAGVELVQSFYDSNSHQANAVDIDALAQKLGLGVDGNFSASGSLERTNPPGEIQKVSQVGKRRNEQVVNELAAKIARILLNNQELKSQFHTEQFNADPENNSAEQIPAISNDATPDANDSTTVNEDSNANSG